MASPRRVAVALVLVLPGAGAGAAPAPAAPGAPAPEPTVLLVCSRKKQHLYVFPKGGVENGESPDQAAQREAWEEAGLVPDSATHLAHLLTLADPSPHILSPTTDPASPSFVASCEYSFELFLLPAPAPLPATSTSAAAVPVETTLLDSCAALLVPSSSSSSAASSPPASAAPSPKSHPPPAPLPAHIEPVVAQYAQAYLASAWPEAGERHRLWVHGWDELERTVCWGRREAVMRQAVGAAREWVGEWWARGGHPLHDGDGQVDGAGKDAEGRDLCADDDEEAKGRL